MNDPNEAFVLGVDLDGVCGDYAAALRDVRARLLGVPVAEVSQQQSWNFVEWGLDRAGYEDLHRRAVMEHRVFRDMPVIAGAAETLWRLSDAGAWIRVITHRLYQNWGHAIAVGDTVEWLDRYSIPYRDICFLGAKPEVEAAVYVDDAPHNIEALRRAGNTVIVFDQPYNQDLDGPRGRDWAEVGELVLGFMADRGHFVEVPFAGLGDEATRLPRHRPEGDQPA